MDRFEDHIELHHLKALMDQFRGHQPTEEMPIEGTYTPGRVIQREAGNVTLGEFKEMLSSIGVVTSESQMEILFAKIDTSADGMVDLNEFFNYMLLHYREKDKIIKREGMKVVGAPSIQHLSKIKQDTIQALVVSDHPLRYISLSKEGYLCSFDHNMELEMTHLIGEDSHDPRAVTNHRRFRSWCTGLAYLGNINMIAVSSSGRDIKFFDVVAQGFVEIFNLYDIQDVPSCLDYWYDVRKSHDESLLLMGGDMGSIHLFYFHKPCKRLFEFDGKTDQRVQQIWMPELSAHHHEYVRHTKLNNIHTEMVRKVKYLPVKDLVISSSGSSKTSVVIADVKGQRRSYVFKRKKGVECFDYSSKLNLLLTGSVDHKVLAWNPYMEHKPMAVLLGHQMAVMGVAINDATGHGYSLSKDGILKVWELHDYHCLQTLLVDFPCLWKQPDFVQASVLLHQDRILVISLRDYLAHLRVGKTEDFVQGMVTAHNTQLCSAIYNPFFQQVATGADDSSISVWDVESGVKSYSITGAHGTEEITCMAFSKTGRKLYTGARNGSIKVWNFQNGHNIHQCEAAADAEVTGLVSLGKKGFLAVGWSRQITFYDDSDSDGVECFDYSSKLNLLLTGSVDHKVLAWNPYMEHKPMAVLLGHQMAVMGVAINDATGHGYSLSKDGILKVWELHDYHCLQTLLVDFPCLWKQPDFVQASVLLHQDRILVISLRDYLAHLRVGKTEDFVQGMVTTHNTQLCSAIYNPFFQQVATGADDSSISVWDVESGVKSYSITGAHGTEEITCMAFSKTGRKLYTGARNGSIKVWNFQNGHNIHQCEAAADAEVTGLVSLGKKGFLAVGWSRQITFYDDSDSDVTYIKPDADWRGGHLHKDDILSVDHSSPGLLATASFDGEILIWSSETQHRLFRLRGGQSTEEAQRLKAALLFGDTSVMDQPAAVHGTSNPPDLSSRPNSRHFSSYKRPVGFSQAPVDKLLFLHHRIHQGLNDCAVLVSSEAGYLHFWSVYDTQHYKGKFYSSSYPDQSVLALATDPENEMLLSVDTKGLIYIWDIHQYCINSENQVVSYTPPLITSWMSHEAAVVSVEVVSLPYGSFVLSASVDQTARLWTVQGHYVGTFGQDEKWNLRDPATYLHTRNPTVQDEAESEDEEGNSETTHTESQHKESTGSLDDLRGHERDEGPSTRTYLPPPDDGSNKINSPARVDSTIPSESNGTTESATSADRETNGHREEPKLNKRVKASPHVLGQRVETGFANIAETRKQRRDKLLQLENPEELTYGMQCTPFKALITPETAEIDFLSSLPLSTRMQQQGLSINSENDLRKLTFDDNDLNFRMFHKPPKERGSTLHLPKI